MDTPQMLPVAELHAHSRHPYRVVDDEAMLELSESIKNRGVLTPALARTNPNGDGWELISGHRRKRACELAGLDTMPVIVLELNDDEAVILMVESNFQREKLLVSEKAWSYRIRLEAMKRQTGRRINNSRQLGADYERARADDALSEKTQDSARQILRYIRLTYLIPGLLDKVDRADPHEAMSISVGVLLSYLHTEEQSELDYLISNTNAPVPGMRQAAQLRELSERGELTQDLIIDVLQDYDRSQEPRIILRHKEMRRYFPDGTTTEEINRKIIELLERYRRNWMRNERKTEEDK